ncbi:hypothetical protein T552_03149 [Pneumocystis carinii B80]|uniref:DNA replication checkpoint mediator MRC1 domain-containing protein n=1 Tax=Pneumocystis carinii (strain B80) TaxID=1408658 RepID=A0A0W4ZC33_PNEC8|nr:hypothetical protein T552_03149 [Pneumocystis carinii B80]KTW25875.1 hypothetical protein T552_03149 [Pneumocystis carinii B80]
MDGFGSYNWASLRKTYKKSQALNDTDNTMNFTEQNESEISDSLSSFCSSPSSPRSCFNVGFTPRSKVKAMLAEFDMDKSELYDSKHDSSLSNSPKQFIDVGKYVDVSGKNHDTYLNENLSLGVVSTKDSAYERVKNMLVNKNIIKNDKNHHNINGYFCKKKKREDYCQKYLNRDASNILDIPLFLESFEKTTSDSNEYEFSNNAKSKCLELKEKMCLSQLSPEKCTRLEMQKVNLSFDDISLDHSSKSEKDYFPVKTGILKKVATKKGIEGMRKETERMNRDMALAPEIRTDKKTSILSFLRNVGYGLNVSQESLLDKRISDENSDTIYTTESNISFIDNNLYLQNNNSSDISPKDQAQLLSNFEKPDIKEKFSKTGRSCLTSKQINPVNYKNQKKIIFKTPVSENTSDSELEVECLVYDSKIHKDNPKLFSRFGNTSVSYSELARLSSPSQHNRIKNNLFDRELLMKVAEQVKSERLEHEEEYKQKGITSTFEERAKEIVQAEDLVEKARLEAEVIRKKENRIYNDDNSNCTDVWDEEISDVQSSEGSNETIDYNSENDNEDIYSNSGNGITCSDNDDKNNDLNLEDIRDVSGMYASDEVYHLDSLNTKSKGIRYIPDEMEDAIIKSRTLRNNNCRIIMEDDEYNDIDNAKCLKDCVDDTLNLSQVSSILSTKNINSDLQLKNNAVDKVENSASDVGFMSNKIPFELFQMNTNVNLKIPDDLNNANCKSSCSFDDNFEKVEKEFQNAQLSISDLPSSDIVFDNFPLSSRYPHLDDALNSGASAELSSGVLIQGDLKRKKSLVLRNSEDENYNDIASNNNNILHSDTTSKYSYEVDNKHFICKPEDFIEDQAQESDDEYAGLGGASDDDNDDLDNKEIEDIIDNTISLQDIDSTDIAAYYMKKEMDDDSKIISNLLNDITMGNLRKRRGMFFDLNDLDDEEETLKRRNKRACIIKQKLLDNQNLSFMADNPKMKAFLTTIEDNQEDTRFSIDFIDNESFKAQENINDATSLTFSNTTLNIDNNIVKNTFESETLYSSKYLEKESLSFVEDENSEIFKDELIDNDMERRFSCLTDVVDRTSSRCVLKESSSSLMFNAKGKLIKLFSNGPISQKKHSLFSDNKFQLENKENPLGEILNTNVITSKLASRAVNYNKPIAKNIKTINSKLLNKEVVNEKRKNVLLKLFQANTIAV